MNDNKMYKGLKENIDRFKHDLSDEKTRLLFSIAYKQGYDQVLEQQTKSLQEFNNYLLDLYTDRDSYSRGKLLDLVKDKVEELFG